uniref:Uncharacterized protein n=1 Tax=Meloidogyne hapla TaxID=6305 RepID=A0A1I8B1I5_MELHA
MISQVVRDNYQYLKQLAKTKSMRRRKRILKQTNTEQLLSLAEICLNILRNRVQLTKRQKCRLVPYADFVRSVSRVRTERGARRMVIQKGNGLPLGFFPALLTPIIIEISKNIASHFSQNKNGQ